jgi:hypothetical protein
MWRLHHVTYPEWLRLLSILSLAASGICFLWAIVDLLRGNQPKMWIMNIVWPVTMLYSGPLGLWAYYRLGRDNKHKPFWQSVAVAATHCGSGCTLGDIVAEVALLFFPVIIFGNKMLGGWTLDYVLALLFGLAFQYFTIKPMKNLSTREGIWAAIKADTLSLTAWQVGMYGWMAITIFLIFGHDIEKSSPVFWFMMQIAMILGFLTSYPVNWWLLKKGIKEAM